MVPVVELRGLAKQYGSFFKKKKVSAVDGIDLKVEKGEILGFLGPNGAGKTTTIKLICGLLKPSRGSVFIEGWEVEKHRGMILPRLGAVLEGSRNFHWPLTIKENLSYFGSLKNLRGKGLKKNVDHLLQLFDLQEKANVQARLLSQGMKQKLSVALALISDPVLLLLDEPTSNLDVQSSRSLQEKIRELAQKDGKTVIITTHNMEVAQEICDRIAIINRGKIVASDSVENLIGLFSEQRYELKLGNYFPWEKLQGLTFIKELQFQSENGCNTLTFTLKETSGLYDIMDILRREEAIIESINKQEASLEDIFLSLTK